ncbi:hypothetical protein DVB69_04635 [Sporosarcina sp. BI001-red]|nr:hypothetical protein DVB69_04635 [Sporosarcina sp. BI001-red]
MSQVEIYNTMTPSNRGAIVALEIREGLFRSFFMKIAKYIIELLTYKLSVALTHFVTMLMGMLIAYLNQLWFNLNG